MAKVICLKPVSDVSTTTGKVYGLTRGQTYDLLDAAKVTEYKAAGFVKDWNTLTFDDADLPKKIYPHPITIA